MYIVINELTADFDFNGHMYNFTSMVYLLFVKNVNPKTRYAVMAFPQKYMVVNIYFNITLFNNKGVETAIQWVNKAQLFYANVSFHRSYFSHKF